jgi:hypothetical protein
VYGGLLYDAAVCVVAARASTLLSLASISATGAPVLIRMFWHALTPLPVSLAALPAHRHLLLPWCHGATLRAPNRPWNPSTANAPRKTLQFQDFFLP